MDSITECDSKCTGLQHQQFSDLLHAGGVAVLVLIVAGGLLCSEGAVV